MKLDPDLVRKILIAYEELPYQVQGPIEIPGYTEDQLNYHQELLIEAGYLKAEVAKFIGGNVDILPERLTYYGHEFLNASRDDIRWDAVKSAMLKSGGFVMEVAKALLIALLKEHLHLD